MNRESDHNGKSGSHSELERQEALEAAGRAVEEAAGLLPSWREDDEILAYYVTAMRFEGESAATGVRAEFAAIEKAAREDPHLRRRLGIINRRLDLAANASDAAASFERLTGHRLGAPATPAVPSTTLPRERLPERPRIAARRIRIVPAALLAAAACYALLALISASTRPEYLNLAHIGSNASEVGQALRLRGGETDAVAAQHLRYLYARMLLTKARRSTLGLFTHYERDQVEEAIDLLNEAVEHSQGQPELWALSLNLLARAHLANGDVRAARLALLRVAAHDGTDAAEARALLARLDRWANG